MTMGQVEELIKVLGDQNVQSRERAPTTLMSMGHDALDALLQELSEAEPKRCWEIITLLTKLRDPRATPYVAEFLFSNHGALRLAAAQCLGQLEDPRATVPLLNAIPANEHSGALVWIVQALGRLGDPSAVHSLLEVIKETDSTSVRYTAIEAVGLIGDPRAINLIEGYLHDPSHHVRSRAKVALERLGADIGQQT